MPKRLRPSIAACAANGKRLLDEAELLEFERPPATQYFLSVIAQEELAKAFLLYLVAVGVIPFSPLVLRASRDHNCKHLLRVVLEFLTPDTEKFLERMNAAVFEGKDLDFPPKVADAINIFRHEKLGRWESDSWVWAEDPEWDKQATKVAKGTVDREKQKALYVDLRRDGSLASTPKAIREDDAREEYDRGRRFQQLIDDLVEFKRPVGLDYERVEEAFKLVFSTPKSAGEP